MKAVHYNAVNTAQRNLPTIWHSPLININHISTFIDKIPIAHKNKLWERHCDSENDKQLSLLNLDSLMFSIVALCIKIHDRTIKTPSQDKLMPRLKIYCKNIKWNIKQKNKKIKLEKLAKLEIKQLKEKESKKEKEKQNEKSKDKEKNKDNDKNENNENEGELDADETKFQNGNSSKSDNKSKKDDQDSKDDMKNDVDDVDNDTIKENSKEEIDESIKNMNKYLIYDDFVNYFHRWMVEGPPPPTPEQQEKMLYFHGYNNGDSDGDDSDDDNTQSVCVCVNKQMTSKCRSNVCNRYNRVIHLFSYTLIDLNRCLCK